MLALCRILDQLARLIAKSKGRADWQKYPKNRQSIRKQQPETLESKTCHAFPGKGVRPRSALQLNFVQPFSPSILRSLCERFKFPTGPLKSEPGGPGPRFGSDTAHWPMLQPLPISQSGTASLQLPSSASLCQSRVWLPRNPNGGPS